MDVREFRDVDQYKRWELLYEDVYLVLLGEHAPLPWRSELLAFELSTLRLIWRLSPGPAESNWITTVWIRGGKVFAGAFAGVTYILDWRTGKVLDSVFTK